MPGKKVSKIPGSRDGGGGRDPGSEGPETMGLTREGYGSPERIAVTDPGGEEAGRSASGNGHGMMNPDSVPEHKAHRGGAAEPHPDEKDPFPPGWHRADRDWKICGSIPLILFFIIGTLLVRLDLHTHGTMMIFFLPFLGFIGLVSGFFFVRAFGMREYGARFIFYRFGADAFIPGFRKGIKERYGQEPENIDPVSGHTFGLLIPRATWRLSSGEVVEVSDLKGPMTSVLYGRGSGNSLGIYFLAFAREHSELWAILDTLIAGKEASTSPGSPFHTVR